MMIMVGLLWCWPSHAYCHTPPEYNFEAPEALQPIVTSLQTVNSAAIQYIMEVMGLQEPGPPIRVILAPNSSPHALDTPEWMSGYALGHASTIVLFTDRTSTYPNNSIHEVFLHEIAHILAYRAAGGQPVPRWLDEGLAMMAARTWDLEDRARLVWAMVTQTRVTLDELNDLFISDAPSVRRAYVLAHAFTLDLIEHTDPQFPKRLLAKIKQGEIFQEAFAQTAFMTLRHAEKEFWNRQTLWNRWIPVATSSGMVWITITCLAFWVYSKQRRRSAVIRQQWKDDDWEN